MTALETAAGIVLPSTPLCPHCSRPRSPASPCRCDGHSPDRRRPLHGLLPAFGGPAGGASPSTRRAAA